MVVRVLRGGAVATGEERGGLQRVEGGESAPRRDNLVEGMSLVGAPSRTTLFATGKPAQPLVELPARDQLPTLSEKNLFVRATTDRLPLPRRQPPSGRRSPRLPRATRSTPRPMSIWWP